MTSIKSIFYIAILALSSSAFGQKFQLDDLAGSVYKLSPKGQITFLGNGRSFHFKLAIDKSKDDFSRNLIGLNEYITQVIGTNPPVELSRSLCLGKAELTEDHLMEADISCPNQQFYEMKIDFSRVSNKKGNSFEVPVYISSYHQELIMVMEKEVFKISSH